LYAVVFRRFGARVEVRRVKKATLTTAGRAFGFAEWFRPGEYQRAEAALESMARTTACYVRAHLSWAEYHAPGGQEWYDWLVPQISQRFDFLPCIHYTPPSLSRTGTSAGPPHRLLDYADFVDHVLTRYGTHLDTIELWNEPNNLLDWDWRVDPDWTLFCEMIGAAGHWARERGFRTVLGGPCPFDTNWLNLMGERGVLGVMSAVGLHGFPGTWDSEASTWGGWEQQIVAMRGILDKYNKDAEIWITEAGYSTWRRDEAVQASSFLDALAAPADRLYWYGWQDIADDVAIQEGLRFDDRHYHMGVVDSHGRPKLLGRLLTDGGVDQVHKTLHLSLPNIARPADPVVLTGGAGFIGCALADSILGGGQEVIVFDNLSQSGADGNLEWLKSRHGARVHAIIADIRDETTVREVVRDAAAVFHLAAQEPPATLADSIAEFDVNARGTLNMLEAVRRTGRPVPFIHASTADVYGLDNTSLHDPDVVEWGVGEHHPLRFATPFAASKGSADQYVLSYAAAHGLPAAVLRLSSIYGPSRSGEAQAGWVTRLVSEALKRSHVTIASGVGNQLGDVLYITDAVCAFRAVLAGIAVATGEAYNIGGGPEGAVNELMVLDELQAIIGRPLDISFNAVGHCRRRCVVDTRKIGKCLGWRPSVPLREGLTRVHDWLCESLGDARLLKKAAA
jgi:CDP-paratose 2-epimerase